MKIVVITGSQHKNGTSNYLVESFIQGAKKEKNEIYCFNACTNIIHPCLGCNVCRKNMNCVWNDSFNELKEKLLLSDIVVFATPIYYMNMTSQLKTVIDSFYQLEMRDNFKSNKKYILLVTAWDKNPHVFDIIKQNFELITKFLKWSKFGEVLACGVDNLEDIKKTTYAEEAYKLGRKIKRVIEE